MKASSKAVCLTIGLLLTLAGAAGSFVMLLQPWRSCPEIDDSSAGCPATSSDTALLGLAIAVFLFGVAFLIMSRKPERIPLDAAGPFGKLD
ncbi:hypothetical protein CQ018_08710 [Arthrobacter sp. MYb227]|nr:hypothetical protein CQ018_08710 [Arthrobacter sp. MYb227]